MSTYVVKERPRKEVEKFDPIKLHGSIAAACLAVRAYEGQAHLTAQHVCETVLGWLRDKTEITSNDLRRITTKTLAVYHPEAAYVYENYKAIV